MKTFKFNLVKCTKGHSPVICEVNGQLTPYSSELKNPTNAFTLEIIDTEKGSPIISTCKCKGLFYLDNKEEVVSAYCKNPNLKITDVQVSPDEHFYTVSF